MQKRNHNDYNDQDDNTEHMHGDSDAVMLIFIRLMTIGVFVKIVRGPNHCIFIIRACLYKKQARYAYIRDRLINIYLSDRYTDIHLFLFIMHIHIY